MSVIFFFLMIRRPPRSTLDRSSAASDVYKRQGQKRPMDPGVHEVEVRRKDIQVKRKVDIVVKENNCLLYTSPSPRDRTRSRMPSSA